MFLEETSETSNLDTILYSIGVSPKRYPGLGLVYKKSKGSESSWDTDSHL